MASSTWSRALAGLALLLAMGCNGPGPTASRPAPDLSLPDLEGKVTALADLKGTVVLLDFWSTTCQTCLHELPMLNGLQERLGRKGFTVLAVCTDDLASDALKAFAAENRMSYPVLRSEGKAMPGYGLYGLPQAFLIGKDGIIKKQYMGPKMPEEVLRDAERAIRAAP
ncbi:MAG: TlpA family protein disulfide reductase [Elusimicrobia bacterium]|nr:TlpA family protein disulfide reductase [Elusimicrobiota bacterium]